ncbi:phage tail tape measure protein [Clostridium botulinum]|uniref:phage tail tape measure protein n=1 Tax=Clostridium botulinum TaxID=1491 RepID=UPI0004DA4766|nr:phage tail tape measure protein [Clostridium botulinum]KEH90490.1 phage tail tape measure protein [Clostridium botulinum C/D str. It1]
MNIGINVGTAVAYLTLDRSPFQGGLRAAAADLRNFVRGTGEAGGRLGSLGSAMSNVGGSLTKAVTLPIAAASTACTKLAMDFETSMAKVQSIAKASKSELKDMKKDILAISSKSGIDANEVADATYQAISSGVDKSQATKFVDVSSKAAIAGFTDTATAVDGLSTVLNAYGKSAEHANELANEFLITQNKGKTTFAEMASVMGNVAPTAAAAGLTTKELNSSIATLTANGIQTGQAVTGIKAALSNIIKPSTEATKAAKALGINFDANAIKTKGWAGFLMDVRNKLEASSPAYVKKLDEVNKLKKAIEGSSKSTEKYTQEMDAERKKIKALQEEKKNLTSKDKDRKKQIEESIAASKKHIDQLKEEAKAAKKGAGATKEMKKELKAKEKELEILGKTSNSTLSGMATMFGSVEALNSVLTMTSGNGMKLYNDTMQEMNSNTHALDDAYDTMMESPERKMAKAKESLKNLGITLGGFLAPYVTSFADAFAKVINAVNKLPGPVKGALVHTLALVALAGPVMKLSGSFMGMSSGILRAVTSLRNVPGILRTVASGSGGAMGRFVTLFRSAPGLIGKAGTGILSAVKFIGNGFRFGISGLVNIVSSLPALMSPHVLLVIGIIAGIGLIVYEVIKHWDDLKKAADKLWKKIKSSFDKIGNILKKSKEGWKIIWNGFGDFMKGIAKNIWDGFLGGLKSGYDKVTGFFKKAATGIKSTFKSVLDIHSPSRAFKRYGGFVWDGFLGGSKAAYANVSQFMKSAGNSIKTNFMSALNVSDMTKNLKESANNIGSTLLDDINIKKNNFKNRFNGLKESFANLKNENRFNGIEDISYSTPKTDKNKFEEIKNINNSNKEYKFAPTINMYVTIPDTGQKGTEELTNELKSMGDIATKNSMVDLFMKDAIRN